MNELKKRLKENFKKNWLANRFGFRIAFSVLTSIATVIGFCTFIYTVDKNPFILILIVLGAVCACVAFVIYTGIDKVVKT
jgi:hypothetical protein